MTLDRRAALSGMNLVQREAGAWHDRELGAHDPLKSAAKVAEEAGEFVGATLKALEVRNDAIDWSVNARKELGDVFIAAMNAATAQGWDVAELIEERWAVISERRFATAPQLEPPRLRYPPASEWELLSVSQLTTGREVAVSVYKGVASPRDYRDLEATRHDQEFPAQSRVVERAFRVPGGLHVIKLQDGSAKTEYPADTQFIVKKES